MSRPVFAVYLFPLLLAAQAGNNVISGDVKDATGAPIPGAQIAIVNAETGVRLATVANESGLYRVGALIPGRYRIEADAAGFEHLVRRPVTLQIGQTLTVDLALVIGRQSQTMEVTEAAPLIESGSSNVNQVVNREMLAGLPLPNRAASSLAALAPGVVMIDTGAGTAENYPVFSVAGGRARNQIFVLDGGNVTNAVGLTRPQQLTSLPVDAMQEFSVIANNYSAEFGHSTGGVVTMSTRAGTNEFHGSLFESLRNNALDARDFFAVDRPPIRLNQFGASFGGPVRRDETHFFVTWEQTRQLTSDTVVSTAPTLANHAGDFSDLRDSRGQPVAIYDPATTAGRNRSPFPGNRIPLSRFDPVALAALSYFPLPNRPGTAAHANNFVGSSADTLNRNIVVGRLDHQFRPSDLVTARYYINDSGTENSGTYGIPLSDPNAGRNDVRVQSFLAAHTHVFSPRLINDVRFSYLQRKFIDTRPGYGENLAAQIGLKGVSDAAFPAFTIPGYATLGNPSSQFRIQTPILDRQILESISWYRGKHVWKFGVELRAGANDEIRGRSASGSFTTTALITGLPGVSGTGNALASFLLGEVNSASVQVTDKIRTRASYWAWYMQDDWRATDRLTLNFGLRWEAELPRRELDNRMNSFDPLAMNPVSGTPGIVTFAGANGIPVRAFATDTNNFGPRAGFAYRVPGRRSMVIRGGAGIFYASTISNTVGDSASLGFSDSANYVVDQADLQSVFHLRDGLPPYTRPPLEPGFGAVAPGTRPNTSVAFFNPEQVAPISYQYNLNVQRELPHAVLAEIGYMGNVSHHLTANDLTLNQVHPELMGPGNAQSRRPFPQFSNVVWINPSIGNSTYHAGFVRAERRFSSGFSFLAHYTFSKFLDDVEAFNEYGPTGASYMDAYNRRLDKGRSGSDVPHRLLVTFQYATPEFRARPLLRRTIAGWRIGVLETIQSGAPFTVIMATNTTNAFPAGPVRPNLIGDPFLQPDERTTDGWFDTTAFAAPAPFTFGNSPRSVLRSAPQKTTDITVEKSYRLTEHTRFDLRGEFYNLLNHANFKAPGYTFGAADFGVVSTAYPGRTVQLAARLAF